MGGALRLACDNCIPGDASGWSLPLAAGALVALALAVLCVAVSSRRSGVRAILARVAASALVIGPAGALFLLAADVRYGDTYCGSALSASLERPRPGHDLDERQEGCRRNGADRVSFAAAWAATAFGGAAVCMAAASLPAKRAAYA